MFSKAIQKEVESIGDLRKYLRKNLDSLDLTRGIVKFALHGFWGDVKQLLELYRDGETDYYVKHMVKIREALKQGKQPRVMETQKRTLKVDWNQEYGSCGNLKNEAIKQFELCNLDCFRCPYNQLDVER